MESIDPESSNYRDSDSSTSPIPTSLTSRKTTHYRDHGGFGYGVGVVWTHLRPFLPFFLISCLVVIVVYLLQAIVYGGPFNDPLFFSKFEKRWPPPAQQPATTVSAQESSIIWDYEGILLGWTINIALGPVMRGELLVNQESVALIA